MSQANPVRLFVTHVWENSDDYLRVFEYLESARNFFYRNYSTPDKRPSGDREALREDLRRQIAPVEAVLVIQMDHDFRRFLRRARPLQDFLAPQHPQVVVNDPLAHQLHLRGIPQRIMSLRVFQLAF